MERNCLFRTHGDTGVKKFFWLLVYSNDIMMQLPLPIVKLGTSTTQLSHMPVLPSQGFHEATVNTPT